MALWEDVKKNLIDWYGTAADKTGELAKVGVRRYDIFGISRDIERQFSEIGSHVYTSLHEGRSDFAGDSVLQALVARVEQLESELEAKQAEISAIRASGRRERPAASAAEGAPAGDRPTSDEADVQQEDPDSRSS